MKLAIAFQEPGGSVSICYPAPWARFVSAVAVDGERVELDPPTPFDAQVRRYGTSDLSPEWCETEEDFAARIMAKDVPAGATARIIDASSVPADRTFRGALTLDMTYEMTRAREIHRDRIRAARKSLLAELDVLYQRADEDGRASAKALISAAKQRLRDATQDVRISLATTIAELVALPIPEAALTPQEAALVAT